MKDSNFQTPAPHAHVKIAETVFFKTRLTAAIPICLISLKLINPFTWLLGALREGIEPPS